MPAKQLVTGAMLSALTLVILYMTLLLPTNTLTLLTLASVMVPIALIRADFKTALLVYITSGLISLLFLPPSISMLYLLFFGAYGLIKYFIETINRMPIEWLLKLIFFNFIFYIGFNFTNTLISPGAFDGLRNLIEKLLPGVPYGYLLALILLGQVVFIVYDYALSLLIDHYYDYVHKL